MGKFCTNCGHELKPNLRFCTYCGKELNQVEEVKQEKNEQSSQPAQCLPSDYLELKQEVARLSTLCETLRQLVVLENKGGLEETTSTGESKTKQTTRIIAITFLGTASLFSMLACLAFGEHNPFTESGNYFWSGICTAIFVLCFAISSFGFKKKKRNNDLKALLSTIQITSLIGSIGMFVIGIVFDRFYHSGWSAIVSLILLVLGYLILVFSIIKEKI